MTNVTGAAITADTMVVTTDIVHDTGDITTMVVGTGFGNITEFLFRNIIIQHPVITTRIINPITTITTHTTGTVGEVRKSRRRLRVGGTVFFLF